MMCEMNAPFGYPLGGFETWSAGMSMLSLEIGRVQYSTVE